MNEKNLIADFVLELERAEDLEGCFAALTKAVTALGLGGVIYTSIPLGLQPLHEGGPIFLRSEEFDPRFLIHYQESGFAEDDFTIKRITAGDLAVMDWWSEERKGLLTPGERRVIETAREEYRLTNGISIPTMSCRHQIAGASIVSDERDERFALLLHDSLPILRPLVRLFHDRIYAHPTFQSRFYSRLCESLSERERDLLRFTAQGLPLKVYQDLYGVSPSVAGNQRSRLFDKLGVKNSAELMYFVGLLRLLEMM